MVEIAGYTIIENNIYNTAIKFNSKRIILSKFKCDCKKWKL